VAESREYHLDELVPGLGLGLGLVLVLVLGLGYHLYQGIDTSPMSSVTHNQKRPETPLKEAYN